MELYLHLKATLRSNTRLSILCVCVCVICLPFCDRLLPWRYPLGGVGDRHILYRLVLWRPLMSSYRLLSPSLARPGGAQVRRCQALSAGRCVVSPSLPTSAPSAPTFLPAGLQAQEDCMLSTMASFFWKGGFARGRELSPKHISTFTLEKKNEDRKEGNPLSVAFWQSRKIPSLASRNFWLC